MRERKRGGAGSPQTGVARWVTIRDHVAVRRSLRAPLAASAFAVAVLAAGLAIFLTHRYSFPGGVAVGFASYEPLDPQSISTGGVLWSETAVVGLGLVVVGLVLLAGVGGFTLGRRRRAVPSTH